jgi:hypothetical protein
VIIVFETVNDKAQENRALINSPPRLCAGSRGRTRPRDRGAIPLPPDRRMADWHNRSGKSLSMVFLVGLLRRLPELDNPLFLLEVDRNDLDNQLSDQFIAARQLVGDVRQAQSVDNLRDLLQTQGGGVILTTIEKF